MKIVHRNLKEGIMKLKPETLDDLWYLKSILEKGDVVGGKGYRRIRDEEKIRPDKGERVPVHLEIDLESAEFHPHINRLRISGVVKSAPEDLVSLGVHHTLDVQPNDVITVKKEWKNWQVDRIKEAEKTSQAPLVLIVSIEEGEADIALVRRYGVDFLVRIAKSVAGKRMEEQHEVSAREFYGSTAAKLAETAKKEGIKGIIIAGPGFAKDNLFAFLKEKYPDIASISHLEGIGSGGRTGVHEVLKRGAVERVAAESMVAVETILVEKLLAELAKGSGLAAYGPAEVKKALNYGAVDKLLLSDVYLRTNKECDALIEAAKKTAGEVVITSTEHEAGEKLESLGGIAALLRFPVA